MTIALHKSRSSGRGYGMNLGNYYDQSMVGRDTDNIRPLGIFEYELGQRITVLQAYSLVSIEWTEEEMQLHY